MGNENECFIFVPSRDSSYTAFMKVYNKVSNTFRTFTDWSGTTPNDSCVQPIYNSGVTPVIAFVSGRTSYCFAVPDNGVYKVTEYTGPNYYSTSGLYSYSSYSDLLPINDKLLLREAIGTVSKDEDKMHRYVNVYIRSGNTFSLAQSLVYEFTPNYNMSYTIENNEVKKLSFNYTDGSYSTQSLDTPIILEFDDVAWITNDVIIGTRLVDNNRSTIVYKIDFTNYTLNKLCDISNYLPFWSSPNCVFWNFGNKPMTTFVDKISNTSYIIYKYAWGATQEDKVTSIIRGSTTFSNVSDGDITADDVVKGKTGYGLNGKVYGNLEVGLTKAEYEEALATALLIKPDEKGTDIRDDEMTP